MYFPSHINAIRPKLLGLIKESLEQSLIELRDQQIGNQCYERGCVMKRYEFSVGVYLDSADRSRLEEINNLLALRSKKLDRLWTEISKKYEVYK